MNSASTKVLLSRSQPHCLYAKHWPQIRCDSARLRQQGTSGAYGFATFRTEQQGKLHSILHAQRLTRIHPAAKALNGVKGSTIKKMKIRIHYSEKKGLRAIPPPRKRATKQKPEPKKSDGVADDSKADAQPKPKREETEQSESQKVREISIGDNFYLLTYGSKTINVVRTCGDAYRTPHRSDCTRNKKRRRRRRFVRTSTIM